MSQSRDHVFPKEADRFESLLMGGAAGLAEADDKIIRFNHLTPHLELIEAFVR